jgi:23S rRNA pseudouridine1911/1915/1917 synthase
MVKGGMGKASASKIDLRQQMFPSGTPGTKDSLTRFMVKEQLKGYVLLACNPLTGRTNQIRVHLEELGLPLAGDKLYGRTDEEYLAFIAHVKGGGDQGMAGKIDAPRHMLHAWKLGLRHPVTGERMQWEAPMPGDMQEFIKANR